MVKTGAFWIANGIKFNFYAKSFGCKFSF